MTEQIAQCETAHSLCRKALCRCECHRRPASWNYSNRLSPEAQARRQARIAHQRGGS